MRLRLLRPRDLALALRGLARRRPAEAEQDLASPPGPWARPVEGGPPPAPLPGLDTEAAADVLEEVRYEAAADILEELQHEAAADILEELPPDEAADIVR